jgi:site-specific DNA-cytosine methylase
MGVDGRGLANDAPGEDFAVDGQPRLTVAMTARIQAFPDDWVFSGKKHQPVAQAVAETIREVLDGTAAQHRFYLLPQQVMPI